MRSAVAAAACAVALCGCGDDDSGGTGGRLSKDEYEERFREIVSAPAREAPSTTPTMPQEQAEDIDKGLDRMRSVASDLDELEAPREIADAHAMFVAGLRAGVDDAEKLVRALRAGDERRAEAMLDRGTLFEPATGQMIGRARLEFSEKGYDLGGVSAFP